MSRISQIRRDFADQSTEPWRGGFVAEQWCAYVLDMLGGKAPLNRAPCVAVHVRFQDGQLVSIRPRTAA